MEIDRDGLVAGSRCLQAALQAKDEDTARALFAAAARYFGKGLSPSARCALDRGEGSREESILFGIVR